MLRLVAMQWMTHPVVQMSGAVFRLYELSAIRDTDQGVVLEPFCYPSGIFRHDQPLPHTGAAPAV